MEVLLVKNYMNLLVLFLCFCLKSEKHLTASWGRTPKSFIKYTHLGLTQTKEKHCYGQKQMPELPNPLFGIFPLTILLLSTQHSSICQQHQDPTIKFWCTAIQDSFNLSSKRILQEQLNLETHEQFLFKNNCFGEGVERMDILGFALMHLACSGALTTERQSQGMVGPADVEWGWREETGLQWSRQKSHFNYRKY